MERVSEIVPLSEGLSIEYRFDVRHWVRKIEIAQSLGRFYVRWECPQPDFKSFLNNDVLVNFVGDNFDHAFLHRRSKMKPFPVSNENHDPSNLRLKVDWPSEIITADFSHHSDELEMHWQRAKDQDKYTQVNFSDLYLVTPNYSVLPGKVVQLEPSADADLLQEGLNELARELYNSYQKPK